MSFSITLNNSNKMAFIRAFSAISFGMIFLFLLPLAHQCSEDYINVRIALSLFIIRYFVKCANILYVI